MNTPITLKGTVTLTRALLNHVIWEQDLAVRAGAVDLLLRANNRAADVMINGQLTHLRRGQIGYSQERLAREWGCSVEKLVGILRWLDQKAEFLVVEKCGPRGTIITILNYDRYNAESGTETGTISGGESGTESGQNKEEGKGIGKGEGKTAPFAEVPSDEEVEKFCAQFKDLGRGVESIPAAWWRGWLASALSSDRGFPRDWRRILVLRFRSDWDAGHSKARAGIVISKNGAGVLSGAPGQSPAQRKFLIDQELRMIRERLDAAHGIGVEPDPEDVNREQVLEKMAAVV